MDRIKVLIIDDHKLFIKGMSLLLSRDKSLHVIGDALNGKEGLEKIKELQPNVVLLDLNMPGLNGDEVCKISKKEFPNVKIIIISMHDDDRFIAELIQSGANGYLLKNSEPEEVREAIKKVHTTGKYYDERIAEAMQNYLQDNLQSVDLTSQEKQVLRLLCAEKTSKEIAGDLNLTEKTIEFHRKNLFAKTKSKNMAGLVKYAFQNNLTDF